MLRIPSTRLPSRAGESALAASFLYRFRFVSAALALLATLVFHVPESSAQGCIAIRNNPGTPLMDGDFSGGIHSGQWVASVAYRWFKSDRHFTGSKEHPERKSLGTYVENDVHSVDFAATYGINDRWSVTIDVPYLNGQRSSLYEHDLVNRHSMSVQGLGDLRVIADRWMFDPHTSMNGNIAIGFGLKLPTGKDDATDTVYRATGPVERPLDPSMQPGDGGWGIIVQVQAFRRLTDRLFFTGSASYMFTPEEQSGTEFTIADVPAFAAFIRPENRYNTIADQYTARAGLSYLLVPARGINTYLGMRIEGLPAADLIGGDMGWRRPGYTISWEPGISWTSGRNSVALNVPIALYRNRVRSEVEKVLGRPGGDSAFADYSILLNYSYAF